MSVMTLRLRALILSSLLLLTLLGGCATNNPRDPLEPMNRAIYSFNDGLDNVLLKPVAQGYRAVLPQFVRTGVSNFFANINDVIIALNNLLQGKVLNAVSDVGRVAVNSTIGILGLFDPATEFGLEKHNEDFGQTLGYWGVGDGAYLVLPLFGPSNIRDAVGRFVDFKTDPLTYVHSMRARNILWGTRLINTRADLLDTSKILETAALDPYEFVRDAYLQRRRNLVFDGAPPMEKDDDTDIKTKPRTDLGPFPMSAEESPRWNRGNEWTPAREEAAERARDEQRQSLEPRRQEPRAELPLLPILPDAPTAAGGNAAVQPQSSSQIVRVWLP